MTSVQDHGRAVPLDPSLAKPEETIKKTVSEALGHRVKVLTDAKTEVETKIEGLSSKIKNSNGIRGFFTSIGPKIQKLILESTSKKLQAKIDQKNAILTKFVSGSKTSTTKEGLEGAQKACKASIASIDAKMAEISSDSSSYELARLEHGLGMMHMGGSAPKESDVANREALINQMLDLQTQRKVLTAHDRSLSAELTGINAKEASAILDEIKQARTNKDSAELEPDKLTSYENKLTEAKQNIDTLLIEVKNRTSLLAVKLGIGKGAKQVKQLQEKKKIIDSALEQVTAVKENTLKSSTVIRLRIEIKNMNFSEAIIHLNRFLPRKKMEFKGEQVVDQVGLKALYDDLRSKMLKSGTVTLPQQQKLPPSQIDLTGLKSVPEKETLHAQLTSPAVNALISKWEGKDIDFSMVANTYGRAAGSITIGDKKLEEIFKDSKDIVTILKSDGARDHKALLLLEAFDRQLEASGVKEPNARALQIKNILTFGTIELNPSSVIGAELADVKARMDEWSPDITGEMLKSEDYVTDPNKVTYAFGIDQNASVTLVTTKKVSLLPKDKDSMEIGDPTHILTTTGTVKVKKDGEVDCSVTIIGKKVTEK